MTTVSSVSIDLDNMEFCNDPIIGQGGTVMYCRLEGILSAFFHSRDRKLLEDFVAAVQRSQERINAIEKAPSHSDACIT